MMYGEWDACTECGLDLWEWYNDGYTRDFKVRVMAFVNMRRAISAHSEDAMARYAEKKQKKR